MTTSGRTFWRHDEHFVVMTNFLSSWRIVFLTSWRNLWCHDVFVTHFLLLCLHSALLHVMTKFFDVMIYFWWHDELFNVMAIILTSRRHFLTSYKVFDVMTYFWPLQETFWRHDAFFKVVTNFFEVMTYFFLLYLVLVHVFVYVILTSWRIFDIMTIFLASWYIFWRNDDFLDVMTHFLTSWRTFWHYD